MATATAYKRRMQEAEVPVTTVSCDHCDYTVVTDGVYTNLNGWIRVTRWWEAGVGKPARFIALDFDSDACFNSFSFDGAFFPKAVQP